MAYVELAKWVGRPIQVGDAGADTVHDARSVHDERERDEMEYSTHSVEADDYRPPRVCHVEPGDRVFYTWEGQRFADEVAELWPAPEEVGTLVRMLSGRVVLPFGRVCIVDPDRDGPTLWDCECDECRRLQGGVA